jgi:hypothetical protein
MPEFSVSRSLVIAADAAVVFDLIDDFHQWRHWSPWEDSDPEMRRNYTGPMSGVGAGYSWSGNRKAGAGRMEIVSATPSQRVEIALTFLKPFTAENSVRFEIQSFEPGLVRVTWSMSGRTSGLMGVLGRVVPMDRMVGRDFEKGLAKLKLRAEDV